ncbi:MAG TPA: lysine-sensitive aspartokinase 3, partial [Blastocatellia bacterium]|nr:lysine-sensitive aspartokinase 3 [Blastocatellia bacterium]
MIVMKFGGTSVEDAKAISQAARIVTRKLDRAPVVVVSAMARVTDALLELARAAGRRQFEAVAKLVGELRDRHLGVAAELLADGGARSQARMASLFDELEGLARSIATLGELTPRSQDAIVSFGERLSSIVVAAALEAAGTPAELVDSRRFIITDNQFTAAAPDFEETARRTRLELLPVTGRGAVPVAQG